MTTNLMADASAFSVSWQVPEDAGRTWLLDPIHFPRPLSPLFRTLWGPAFADGINRAAREVLSPGFDLRVAFQNGYYYESVAISEPATDEELAALRVTEAALDQAIAGLMERWQREWLPRLTATRGRLWTADVADGSPAALLSLLDELEAIVREDWLIHFRIVWPVMLAMQRFDELYADLFGDAEATDGHALLVGQPTTSVLAGIALSDLAASARATGLADLIMAAPPEEVPALLAASDAGRVLAAAIAGFLDRFGLQQDLFDYALPTWQEDPTIVAGLLQAYLRSGVDARADHDAAVNRGQAALAAARERLAGYPAAVRAEFEAVTAAARAAYYLHLEHNVLIDQQGTSLTRRVLLKAGARLVEAGSLSRPDDVFALTYEELRELAAEPADRRTLVDERRVELGRQRKLVPPPFFGKPPVDEPATSTVERALLRYAGGDTPETEAPDELWGIPGSRGTARGVARVAESLDAAKALRPGEILIAPTTLPSWTPLFALAAAVVTETGGPLSHSAVVAREYGVPAVVGVAGATTVIRTGQEVTVDGGRGVVVVA
jgi:pyruvate,water dikinase